MTGTFTSTTTMRASDLALYTTVKKQLCNISAVAEVFEKQKWCFDTLLHFYRIVLYIKVGLYALC